MGKASQEERDMFTVAYRLLERYVDPPANQDENAADWWVQAAKDFGEAASQWKDYPLMSGLLIAVYDYLDYKAKERTKEMEDFV